MLLTLRNYGSSQVPIYLSDMASSYFACDLISLMNLRNNFHILICSHFICFETICSATQKCLSLSQKVQDTGKSMANAPGFSEAESALKMVFDGPSERSSTGFSHDRKWNEWSHIIINININPLL